MGYLYLHQPANGANVRRYLLARAARVIPLYLVVVALSYAPAQFGYAGLYNIPDESALLAHLLFVYGDSVLWSIAPEIQFYLMFALIWCVSAWRAGYLPVVVIAVLITLFLFNFPRPHGELDGLSYDLHLFRSLPYFLTGVLMGYAYPLIKIPGYLRSHWFVSALIIVPLLYPAFSVVSSDAKMRMWLSYEVLLVMASVFFAIVYVVPDNNVLLSNPIGDFLGKVSYSLYLLHMPLMQSLNHLALPVELKLVVFLVLSLVLAYLSYRLVELPAAKWLRRKSQARAAAYNVLNGVRSDV